VVRILVPGEVLDDPHGLVELIALVELRRLLDHLGIAAQDPPVQGLEAAHLRKFLHHHVGELADVP